MEKTESHITTEKTSESPATTSWEKRRREHLARLFVKGLPKNTTERDLINSFNKAKSVKIVKYMQGNKCVSTGHITFANLVDANEALAVKNYCIQGENIEVTKDNFTVKKKPVDQSACSSLERQIKLDGERQAALEDEGTKHNGTKEEESIDSCTGKHLSDNERNDDTKDKDGDDSDEFGNDSNEGKSDSDEDDNDEAKNVCSDEKAENYDVKIDNLAEGDGSMNPRSMSKHMIELPWEDLN
ncbi:hypothetical protein OTU49_005939 [Cherax quadricarinatus]|uniref:RRM domain-containing protein n=1 Tax=Cherax quadricarinatus TaxID=27406 RepID=A0AAW0X576_CHEQU